MALGDVFLLYLVKQNELEKLDWYAIYSTIADRHLDKSLISGPPHDLFIRISICNRADIWWKTDKPKSAR